MPKRSLKERVNTQFIDFLDEIAIKRLADEYQVSLQAMTIRLEKLGLLTA